LKPNRLFVVLAFCILLSASAFAQKVNVDWDRGQDFSKFKTYAWQQSPHPARGLWDQRIIDGVNQQLQAKGLQLVQSDPDLWVVYTSHIQDQKQVVGTGYNYGPGWYWGPWWGGGPTTTTYTTFITREGTLVVELANAKTHELEWRGSVTDTIKDNSNKNINILNKGITKLFKNYPPQANSK